MMLHFLFYLYRLFIVPYSWAILFILSKVQPQKKWAHYFLDRQKPIFHNRNNLIIESEKNRPVWIHAASGEIEYARPFIRSFKTKYPHIPILVTTTSRSSQHILKNLTEVDFWGPSPWDSIYHTKQFLQKWKPRALLIARTDLWPEIIYQCQQLNIPRLLFSAHLQFSNSSSLLNDFKIYLLKQLSLILAVSDQDVANLKIRGISHVLFCGDTRYDQVFFRLNHPKKLKDSLMPKDEEFVFIAGSTWPEDEAHLIPAISEAISRQHNIKIIIAPHEVDENHLRTLELNLKNKNLNYQRYTSATSWSPNSVLIVDQIGILAEIYTWGQIAFVGGSFKKQVHSVMEPLAAGLYTLVGPYYENNREAIEFQSVQVEQHSLVYQVNNWIEIAEHIQKINSIFQKNTQEKIGAIVKKKTGATEKMMNYLEKNISLS